MTERISARDIVDVRGFVHEVEDREDGQWALVDLARGVPRVWIPARRMGVVEPPGPEVRISQLESENAELRANWDAADTMIQRMREASCGCLGGLGLDY